MKQSLISATFGHIAGALTLMLYFAPSEIGSRVGEWPVYFVMAFLYGAPFVLAIWLLILWPLYRRVPAMSVLWHPAVCIPLGTVAGTLLYFVLLRVVFQFPTSVLLSPGHLLAGAMVGAIACTTGCRFKHREQLPAVA